MKKLFEKHEVLFCILLIIAYIVINSFCINKFGQASLEGAVINTAFSLCLVALTVALKSTAYYGLRKAENPKKYLYFLPLAIIVALIYGQGLTLVILQAKFCSTF